jgi:hypothetical protein
MKIKACFPFYSHMFIHISQVRKKYYKDPNTFYMTWGTSILIWTQEYLYLQTTLYFKHIYGILLIETFIGISCTVWVFLCILNLVYELSFQAFISECSRTIVNCPITIKHMFPSLNSIEPLIHKSFEFYEFMELFCSIVTWYTLHLGKIVIRVVRQCVDAILELRQWSHHAASWLGISGEHEFNECWHPSYLCVLACTLLAPLFVIFP